MSGNAKLKIILGSIIFLLSILIYLNTLPAGFVHDDHFYVEKNELIRDLRYVPQILFSSSWSVASDEGVGQYYRPISHVIYSVTYQIFGLNPSGFHLVNILFHALASVVVFFIALQLLNKSGQLLFPFMAGILFASHPLNSEPVNWISAVTELSFALFFLLAFYLYITSYNASGKMRGGLAAFCFFLSAISKETALALPFILVIYDLVIRRESVIPAFPWVRRYIYFIAAGIIYYLLRIYALGEVTPLEMDSNLYGFIINVPVHFVLYLKKLLFPINLLNYYELEFVTSILEIRSVAALFFTGLFLFFLTISYKKSKTVFFLLLWILLPLIPIFFVALFKKEATFSERYAYIPSVGFVILVAIALQAVVAWEVLSKRWTRTVSVVIFLTITTLYSVNTINRNYAWKDDLTLWQDAIKKPYSGKVAYNNLGNEYSRKGMFIKALEAYTNSLRINPNYAGAHNGIGIVYAKRGFLDDAIWEFQKALMLEPGQKEATKNLQKLMELKRMDESTLR